MRTWTELNSAAISSCNGSESSKEVDLDNSHQIRAIILFNITISHFPTFVWILDH